MKFLSIIAILSVAALVSAAPCRDNNHNHNHSHDNEGDDNSSNQDNSDSGNRYIKQTIGAVGSSGGNKGLLSGLLGGGVLSSTTTNNYVSQKANNS